MLHFDRRWGVGSGESVHLQLMEHFPMYNVSPKSGNFEIGLYLGSREPVIIERKEAQFDPIFHHQVSCPDTLRYCMKNVPVY